LSSLPAAGARFVIVPDVVGAHRAATLALAAAAIQCRLLCNLLDGMLAVEEGFRTKSGDIYNELPDRIADVVILTAAGYALRDQPFGVSLGWLAAVCAVLTACPRSWRLTPRDAAFLGTDGEAASDVHADHRVARRGSRVDRRLAWLCAADPASS
jgi:phosphatidylglycerophosphate synthase